VLLLWSSNRGSIFTFALLHGFSHVHRPANPTLAVYHLPAFLGPHPGAEAALAIPLYLAHSMLFHLDSPYSGD
jgi:hypothetical protein